MQPAIFVDLKGIEPADDAIRRALEDIVGDSIALRSVQARDARGLIVNWPARGETVDVTIHGGCATILTEATTPTYLEWAIAVAFERLGGHSRQKPPDFAGKKARDVSLWERLQLRRRIQGK